MELRRPKVYTPSSTGRPSPSRNELLKTELGFDDSDCCSASSGSDEEPEVDQLSNVDNITMVHIQTLQLEIKQKDKQREEMLLKLKALSDKTSSYKARLTKWEENKRSQMKILKKTHEVVVEDKNKLVADLKDVISDHEKLLAQGTPGKRKGRSAKLNPAPDFHQLVESIETLHGSKAKLTEALLTAQAEFEAAKENAKDTASKHRKEIQNFQLEIKKLKHEFREDSTEDYRKENIDVNISANISRLQDENKSLKQDKEGLERKIWHLQEKSRDEVRNIEEETKIIRQKLREAESKYVNLAATPPKLQVKTVSVVSEEMRKRLDQLIDQNRELEDSLQRTKVDYNATICCLEKELSTSKGYCKELQQENENLSLAKSKLSLAVQRSSEVELLLEKKTAALKEATSKVLELQIQMDLERQRSKQTIQSILQEKEAEIEAAKMEAENSTTGTKELYHSLKTNCRNLMTETQQLRLANRQLKIASLEFSTSIAPLCKRIHKQILREIKGVDGLSRELEERYIKEMKLRKKLHNELVDLKGNIRVYCRVRPLISEDGDGRLGKNVVSFDRNDDSVLMVETKDSTKKFEMEKVFSPVSSQEQVFAEVENLIISCLDGYSVCIFAYGQTGSGKTYTMEGPTENPGVNQRALQLLFVTMQERSKDWSYSVSVSVLEIYNENIQDLLSSEENQKLEIKLGQEGNHVPGLTTMRVYNIDDVNKLFAMGKAKRVTATTNMNEHSSRSHAILSVVVVGNHKATDTTVTAKLNLVDLAGSERVNKSGAEGARMKEAQHINKSLSSLGDVIHALKNNQSHVPFRNSKLTFLLQDSLGGDSKTLMVVQISPALKNVSETICSLTFAERVRMVELGQAQKKVDTPDSLQVKSRTPNKMKTNNVTSRRR